MCYKNPQLIGYNWFPPTVAGWPINARLARQPNWTEKAATGLELAKGGGQGGRRGVLWSESDSFLLVAAILAKLTPRF